MLMQQTVPPTKVASLNPKHPIRPTIRMERLLLRATIEALLKAGFTLRLQHYPDLGFSTDKWAIFESAYAVDDCYIVAHRRAPVVDGLTQAAGERVGWVRFVFGNTGWDSMADNALSLEPYLETVNELADRLAERLP